MAKARGNPHPAPSALSSMTGFARADGRWDARRWTWELRSVNGRGLETRFRLPAGFDHLEPDLRKAAGERFVRGTLNATLALEKSSSAQTLKINEAALEETLRLAQAIAGRIDCAKPTPEGILSVRGVVEIDDSADDTASREAFGQALVKSFVAAVGALSDARAAEGVKLGAVVSRQIDDIEQLAQAARACAAARLGAIRDRIAGQLSELLAGADLPEERLAQEAALLAIKADIREELDRLDAHVSAARALLADAAPIGRRLDFLTQEFNREANTLCSKAQDMDLKRIGLDLKTVIDQMREQVQNIE